MCVGCNGIAALTRVLGGIGGIAQVHEYEGKWLINPGSITGAFNGGDRCSASSRTCAVGDAGLTPACTT